MKTDNNNLRPKFHITGGNGWINDPNGLVKFNGEYHVFFQAYDGASYWGHVKSTDLTHWERLPTALYHDERDDGCWSGSAVVYNGKLWIMYTSYKINQGDESSRQLQALASSDDGIHFVKHGIVIGENELPKEYCPWQFRDPKVLRVGEFFYCFTVAKRRNGRGRVILFKSPDLFKWTFVCDVTDKDCGGEMLECPDYNEKLGLLMYSEIRPPHEENTNLNVYGAFAHFGSFDFSTPFVPDGARLVADYGFDFYAAQTFSDEPVMIGWLGMWERNYPSDKYGFAGMLTVPRRLSRQGNELIQTPIYAGKKIAQIAVTGSLADNVVAGAVKFEIKNLRSFNLKMRKAGDRYASFILCGDEWVFDRSRVGDAVVGAEKDEDSLAGIRRMPCSRSDFHTVEIVFDLFSAEIFVDGKALSSALYPEPDADGLELSVDCDSCTYTRYEIE